MLSFSIVVFILLFRSVVDNICVLIVVTFMTLFLLLVDLIVLSFCLVERWISYKVLFCELSFYYFFVEFYSLVFLNLPKNCCCPFILSIIFLLYSELSSSLEFLHFLLRGLVSCWSTFCWRIEFYWMIGETSVDIISITIHVN